MFDISFYQLLVVAVVALVVIGPERLPETARAIGMWVGRLKRSLTETRTELEKQIGADDIRRELHNENVMRSLEKTRQQIESAVRDGVESVHPQDHPAWKPHEELPDHAHTEVPPTASTESPALDQDKAEPKPPEEPASKP